MRKNYKIKHIEIEPMVGCHIDHAIKSAVEISKNNECVVAFVHNQRQYMIGESSKLNGFKNNNESAGIKVGTVLTAHDSPKMQTDCELNDCFALIIDKQYSVTGVYGDMFTIKSEISDNHGFSTDPLSPDYFCKWLSVK